MTSNVVLKSILAKKGSTWTQLYIFDFCLSYFEKLPFEIQVWKDKIEGNKRIEENIPQGLFYVVVCTLFLLSPTKARHVALPPTTRQWSYQATINFVTDLLPKVYKRWLPALQKKNTKISREKRERLIWSKIHQIIGWHKICWTSSSFA